MASMEVEGKSKEELDYKTSSRLSKLRIGNGTAGRINGREDIRFRQDEEAILPKQSKGLTSCLICLVSAIACLSPYLSLHLSQRVGLLLFESDLVQLRASFVSVIISIVVLAVLFVICELIFKWANGKPQSKRNWLIQRLLKLLVSLLTVLSAISYLALVLMVPQVKQTQRMPMATFDCNANLITIENCPQQFLSHGPEQSFGEALELLFRGQQQQQQQDNQNRLIKKLNCLKYNDKELDRVPTRFLLHHCALVCKPQRQQLHQFGDDLNQDQYNYANDQQLYKRQQAPYDHNYSSTTVVGANSNGRQVSLKVCFSSSEFSSTSNSYKQFCITNLAAADNQHVQGQTMTVGQLNAMLRGLVPAELDARQSVDYASATFNRPGFQEPFGETAASEAGATAAAQVVAEQATHYVNPVVQFESHFKNWPHLHRTTLLNRDGETIAVDEASVVENQHQDLLNNADSDAAWCKFRPIPPFIVNNKPFNDIQCSLEHEYTMTTSSPLAEADSNKIYLRKLANHQVNNEKQTSSSIGVERCNIQCKVNILYQVQVLSSSSTSEETKSNQQQFYLPLKPCLMVSNESDKISTTNHYLLFRSLGDSSLILVFLLLDLLLLFESHHLKQSQLESKRFRLIGLLLSLTVVPLLVAFMFDLIATRNSSPIGAQNNLMTFFQEQVIDLIQRLFGGLTTKTKASISKSQVNGSIGANPPSISPTPNSNSVHQVIDSYILPSFVYAILMFILAINSLKLPLVPFESPLVRVSSVEELGIAPTTAVANGYVSSKLNGNVEKIFKKEDTLRKKKVMMKLISFALVALFMGTQFHLSHLGQTQILLDTFGNPGLDRAGSSNEGTWFTLATTTSSALFLLLLATVFHQEASNFFSQFQMFKGSANVMATKIDFMRKRAKLVQYLVMVSLLYFARSYTLATFNAQTRFKWLMVFVWQVGDLISFPIIWLALTSKLHELLSKHNKQKQLEFHLMAQSALAFIYFILARSLAYLIHSLNVSFHLHSENVDWFIMGFYKPPPMKNNRTSSSSSEAYHDQPESPLFSPLPGERQTYLHASRLFLRYNSLLCFVLALILGTSLAYARYQIWKEKRCLQKKSLVENQQDKRGNSPAQGGGSRLGLSSIDERLSLDLMRIHSASQGGGGNTRDIYPTATNPKKLDSSTRKGSPRAKILFHYNLNRDKELSSNSSSVSTSAKDDTTPETQLYRQRSSRTPLKPPLTITTRPELIIPVEVERDEASGKDHMEVLKEEEVQPAYSERLVSHRHRRVRIFEDNEQWPPSHQPIEKAEEYQNSNNRERNRVRSSRSITFAPTATLIGSDAGSCSSGNQQSPAPDVWRKQPHSDLESIITNGPPINTAEPTIRTSSGSSSTATRASPEPSIDGSTTTNSSANDTGGSYVLRDDY